jgi:hypothetical protein
MKMAAAKGGQYSIQLVKRADDIDRWRKKSLSFYLLCDFRSVPA